MWCGTLKTAMCCLVWEEKAPHGGKAIKVLVYLHLPLSPWDSGISSGWIRCVCVRAPRVYMPQCPVTGSCLLLSSHRTLGWPGSAFTICFKGLCSASLWWTIGMRPCSPACSLHCVLCSGLGCHCLTVTHSAHFIPRFWPDPSQYCN